MLRVDVEHAHVIEAALDGRDQWLVTDDAAAAAAAGEWLGELEGRVNILCVDRLPAGRRPAVGDDDAYDWNRHPQLHPPGGRPGPLRAATTRRSPGTCWAGRSSWTT